MKRFSLFFIILVIVLATSYIDAFTRNDFPEEFLFGAACLLHQCGKELLMKTEELQASGILSPTLEDVKLMADMGLEAFRFSISWTRLIPNGRGPINPKGLLFYKNLIKELQSHGIKPHVTLYQYDLPQALEDEYGGWINRKIIEEFTAFADVCFREFGKDVKLWTTINEATIFAIAWEGAVDEDGRTPSVWDTTSHCHNGSNGDIACDGYHKYKEDVKLMADMGLEAFRFSISWTRLIPNGRGHINPTGLLFYKNLIKELRSYGIEPHVTLYHYDLPQSLEDEYGGWINRKIIEDFTAFADVCFREFGEDVKLWTTINDATIFAIASYGEGIKFGHCTPTKFINCSTRNSCMETYIAGHNMLLAHASASNLYKLKYKSKQRGSIGLSIFAFGLSPYTNSKDDEIATQRAKAFLYGWMLKPLVFGDYPDEMKRTLGSRLPVFSEEESEQVKGSSDFVGIIHYTTLYVTNRPGPSFFPSSTNKGFFTDMGAYIIPVGNSSSFEWEVTPWGLEGVLEYLKQSYNNPPIYILENGTPMEHDSMLQDTPRVEYIQAYIDAVLNAIKNGSDTRGYFVWSMIDLYESLVGYMQSFGMYYVNFSDPGRKRSPKLSASWYTGFLNGTIDVTSQDITQLQSNFSGSSSL